MGRIKSCNGLSHASKTALAVVHLQHFTSPILFVHSFLGAINRISMLDARTIQVAKYLTSVTFIHMYLCTHNCSCNLTLRIQVSLPGLPSTRGPGQLPTQPLLLQSQETQWLELDMRKYPLKLWSHIHSWCSHKSLFSNLEFHLIWSHSWRDVKASLKRPAVYVWAAPANLSPDPRGLQPIVSHCYSLHTIDSPVICSCIHTDTSSENPNEPML